MRTRTLLRGAWRFAVARATGGPAWVGVTLLLTLRCDQRCGYCDFPRHAGDELDTATWKRVLAGLRRAGTVRLGLSGGEPLLRPDLGELVRAAVGQGFVTSLVTNGARLAGRVDEVAPVDYLLATIEGDAPRHDAVRGPGAWADTWAGLEAVRRHGGPRLGLICPVHADNADRLDEPLRAAEVLGVRVFFQPVAQRDGWLGVPFGGLPDDALVRDAFRRLAAWKREGRPVGNSHAYLDLVVGGRTAGLAGRCTAGRYFVTLLPDGRVTPCCMLPFHADLPRVDPEEPRRTAREVQPPTCRGCAISPYVESHLILSLDPRALLGALRW